MEETMPQEFSSDEKPPQFKVNPNNLEKNLGKAVLRAIEAVPKIETLELEKGKPSILALADLIIRAVKNRTNIVVFSYQHVCRGEKRWRTLAITTTEYDPESYIRQIFQVTESHKVVIHGITLLPQVEFQSGDRSLVLAYDGDFQFWLLDTTAAAA